MTFKLHKGTKPLIKCIKVKRFPLCRRFKSYIFVVSSVQRAVLNEYESHAGFPPINLTSCEVGNQSKLSVLFEPVSIFVILHFRATAFTKTI